MFSVEVTAEDFEDISEETTVKDFPVNAPDIESTTAQQKVDNGDFITSSRPEAITDVNTSVMSADNFKMDLPELGISLSVREEEDSDADSQADATFGMSLPTFGFNITVDKDETQCAVGSQIFNDFEKIPSEDPCQLCTCNAGQIECYTQQCQTPSNVESCVEISTAEGSCCPIYNCPQDVNDDNLVGRNDGIPEFDVDTLDKVTASNTLDLNNSAEHGNTEDTDLSLDDISDSSTSNISDGSILVEESSTFSPSSTSPDPYQEDNENDRPSEVTISTDSFEPTIQTQTGFGQDESFVIQTTTMTQDDLQDQLDTNIENKQDAVEDGDKNVKVYLNFTLLSQAS